MHGEYHHCEECFDFDLCFKCYASREATHPGHGFSIRGKPIKILREPAPERKLTLVSDMGGGEAFSGDTGGKDIKFNAVAN